MDKHSESKPIRADAFKQGFMRGFTAPFLFFSPIKVRRPTQFNGSVAKAWADVGKALSLATKEQGSYIEQKTGRQIPRHKSRRKAA
ncbi:hypothetical protein M8997_004215 [Phyllobacterium sp. 21LDTY02-6]|uniref:hypothetical protein n=1 Tax=unclassified Phyllobacterium TaxID=2638441 RepID=UPI0020215150|nr:MULTISPECIES: hypothetical protein [unclassified Phyllobacterium]MCO4316376.1 hypothetical protein [Phyllobacterium sp. 21LDTY02-6]MCX8280820.1 hypothetical protein [Phyllobacterium sp. 0TCS1.6C]MCX8292603.1 hypothetical protein [Phyllobacterium sp. 0TCS1.6A]